MSSRVPFRIKELRLYRNVRNILKHDGIVIELVPNDTTRAVQNDQPLCTPTIFGLLDHFGLATVWKPNLITRKDFPSRNLDSHWSTFFDEMMCRSPHPSG